MSCDSLVSNPKLVNELKDILGSGSGIETLTSPDNNLSCSVVGTQGNISLAENIVIGGNLHVKGLSTLDGEVNFGSLILLNGGTGTNGQVLTSSGGSSNPTWTTITPTGVSGLIKQVGFINGSGPTLTPAPSGTLLTVPLTNLTPGKNLNVIFNTVFSTSDPGNVTWDFNITSGGTASVVYNSDVSISQMSCVIQLTSNAGGSSSQDLVITFSAAAGIYTTGTYPYSVLVQEIQ